MFGRFTPIYEKCYIYSPKSVSFPQHPYSGRGSVSVRESHIDMYDSQTQCVDVCRQRIYAASASVGFWLALIPSCESCSEMRSINKWQTSLDNHAQNLKLSPNMGRTEPLELNFVKGFFKRPGSQRNRYYAYIRCLNILNEGTELW